MPSKHFVLTKDIIDDISFAMEDTSSDYIFDIQEGYCINLSLIDDFDIEDLNDTTRFISLPEWTSDDGYNVLEAFTNAQKNIEVHTTLTKTLTKRHGIFKSFKDQIAKFPDIENNFYVYKDSCLENEIKKWYTELFNINDIETNTNTHFFPLIQEDFIIKDNVTDTKTISEYISLIINKGFPNYYPEIKASLINESIAYLNDKKNNAECILIFDSDNKFLALALYSLFKTYTFIRFIGSLKIASDFKLESFIVDLLIKKAKKLAHKSIVVQTYLETPEGETESSIQFGMLNFNIP